MLTCFPGTIIERNGKSSEEFLSGIFFATKGLLLSQVREITGLDTPVIQNWVNRGWIQKPVAKRYTIDHLARIMIINMLRDVMKLENIVNLMTYINGNVDDRRDDIITESHLYNYIFEVLKLANYNMIFSDIELNKIIVQTIQDYVEPFEGAYEKLINGLKVRTITIRKLLIILQILYIFCGI
jgi:DNA-binding transcriptional MerR regulator